MRKAIHIKEEEKKELQPLQQQTPIQKSKLWTEYCCVFTKIGKDEESLEPLTSDGRKNNNLSQIDIKGAVTLSVTIISFLMAVSYLENIHSSTMSDFIPTVLLSTVSIVSLTLFIIIERKMSGKIKAAKKIPKSSSPSPSLFSRSSSLLQQVLL